MLSQIKILAAIYCFHMQYFPLITLLSAELVRAVIVEALLWAIIHSFRSKHYSQAVF